MTHPIAGCADCPACPARSAYRAHARQDESEATKRSSHSPPLPRPRLAVLGVGAPDVFQQLLRAKEKRSGISLGVSSRLRSQSEPVGPPRSRPTHPNRLRPLRTAIRQPPETSKHDSEQSSALSSLLAHSELIHASHLTRKQARADLDSAPVVAKEEAVVRGPAWRAAARWLQGQLPPRPSAWGRRSVGNSPSQRETRAEAAIPISSYPSSFP